jgi:hypothetical protein
MIEADYPSAMTISMIVHINMDVMPQHAKTFTIVIYYLREIKTILRNYRPKYYSSHAVHSANEYSDGFFNFVHYKSVTDDTGWNPFIA